MEEQNIKETMFQAVSNTAAKKNTMEEKILFFWKNFSVLNIAVRIIPYIYTHPPFQTHLKTSSPLFSGPGS